MSRRYPGSILIIQEKEAVTLLRNNPEAGRVGPHGHVLAKEKMIWFDLVSRVPAFLAMGPSAGPCSSVNCPLWPRSQAAPPGPRTSVVASLLVPFSEATLSLVGLGQPH